MLTSKSIIQELELETGTSIYLQATETRASLSVDGKESQFTLWLTHAELLELRNTINATLDEVSQL